MVDQNVIISCWWDMLYCNILWSIIYLSLIFLLPQITPLSWQQTIEKNLNYRLFDVTMGSFDGAEVCKLVSVLILSQLSNIIKNTDMGLYKDDDLLIIKNPNGPKLDNYKKGISNILKLLGFKTTIYTNLKIANFLYVTLNLKKGIFELYKKENDTPICIHTSSNHPPSIIKQILKSISRR